MGLLFKQPGTWFPWICVVAAFVVSCRGQKSSEPPIVPIQNMFEQSSYGPQSGNAFFEDGLAARPQVPGTIAEGEARTDSRLYQGREPVLGTSEQAPSVQMGAWVQDFPLQLNDQLLQKGRVNYNVYCAPCHGLDGMNDGLVTQRAGGVIRPYDLQSDSALGMPVGQIYAAVTEGVNNWNMPGFAEQMPDVKDRWAVVAYVRALQLSKRAAGQELSGQPEAPVSSNSPEKKD